MWIERVEFAGFGNLRDARIEFKPDRVNLVIEGNEYGKSTVAEAILAVLYDYPKERGGPGKLKERDARKPLAGGPFKAALDITHKDRRLRLVRDFEARTVRVFDLSSGESEITAEFLDGPAHDEVGGKLTGMGRDLFRSTCFVGQRELDEHLFGGDRDLSSLLQRIADSSGSATTSDTAIGVLEETLAHFPYRGRKVKADRLVLELTERLAYLKDKSTRLAADRCQVGKELERLAAVEDKIEELEDKIKSSEYFHLCLEAAELDSRLIKAQERLLRVSELRRRVAALSSFENFPIERQRKVDELWTKRQSRLGDYERLKREIEEKERALKARDFELRERWEGLSEFNVEDAQIIASTAMTLKSVDAELAEARQKRDKELAHVKDEGVDVEGLSGIRKALLSLDSRDVDDAYRFYNDVKAARDQVGECERAVWRAQMIAKEIEEERKVKAAGLRNTLVLLVFLLVFLSMVVGGLIFGFNLNLANPMTVIGLIFTGGVGAAVAFVSLLYARAGSLKQEQHRAAKEEEQRQRALGQEMHSKVMGLEVKLEDLARKAGVANGTELVAHIQSYGIAAARLKDLDMLEQLILSRIEHVRKLTGELESYLQKAGRQAGEVSVASALKLSEDINHYLEDLRSLKSSQSVIDLKMSEWSFLQDELRDLDAALKDHFRQCNLVKADEVEEGYSEFSAAVKSYREYEALCRELERMHQDTTSDLIPDELPKIIERLTAQRDSTWALIQELVVRHPDISELAPATADLKEPGFGRELAAIKSNLEELRREREELTVHVRAATRDFDEHYASTIEEIEEVERDLSRVKQAKKALEIGIDTFRKLSKETHSHWSSRLNEISREMLSSLNSEYESLHFDPDLRLTARRKGHSEPLQPAQIKAQLSVGTREQLHWLARMAVSRFLSHDAPLPIILDEPFSESDDERFLSIMQFVAGTLTRQHQVIVFSCHRARHQWLLGQLEKDLKERLHLCQLEPFSVKV